MISTAKCTPYTTVKIFLKYSFSHFHLSDGFITILYETVPFDGAGTGSVGDVISV